MAAKKRARAKPKKAPKKRVYRKARKPSDPSVPLADLVKKMGRPAIYGPEILNETAAYVATTTLPLIAELALKLNVARQTIHQWTLEADKAEFSYLIEQLSAKQEVETLRGGLEGRYEQTPVRLVLGKHGYALPSSHAISGDEGRPPVGVHQTFEGEFQVLQITDEEASLRYYAQLHPKVHSA